MAEDAADDLSYLIEADVSMADKLATLRHWRNLAVAFEAESVWLKGFSFEQINAPELRRIPHVRRYYARAGLLFPVNSLLPAGRLPSLLWTPIERGLRLELPDFNHNFFAVRTQISPRLVHATEEKEAAAMIVSAPELESYLRTAAVVRLSNIRWTILDGRDAFLLGRPLLPLPGAVYWRYDDSFLPAGLSFEAEALVDAINRRINDKSHDWIVWNEDATYFSIGKSQLQPLSLSSFRLSVDKHLIHPAAQ